MLEADGVKELTGLARSIDSIFVRLEGGEGAPDSSMPADVVPDAGGDRPDAVAGMALGAAAVAVGTVGTSEEVVEVQPPPLPEPPAAEVPEPPPLPDSMDDAVAPDFSAELDPAEAEDPEPLPLLDMDAVEEVDLDVTAPEPHLGAEGALAVQSTPESEIASEPEPTPVATQGTDEDDEERPTELDLAVDAYIAGELAKAGEIEQLGGEMLERRELDPVARSVVRLTVAAGDPPDASVYAVAESIMDPLALEHVVRQLGSERVEETRNEYYLACRTIGEPMAIALRDGLADTTTNRLARRNYCDALRAMGDIARPTIDAMAVDDNRFVCRNALTLLGEIGGERALELVTGQLGNPDARVRREALRSLARIGDADSGAKLMELGLLNDSDDDVRVAAAITAGELRVQRAVKPLMAMLEETKDPDRTIPLIRALGQLEDASAFSLIERYAVPSLFSKPRTDVRIAAYRALYHFGTPNAMKLLAKASSDKDAEVASAVLALKTESRPRQPDDAAEGEEV
jgi:HEAT repeat protein